MKRLFIFMSILVLSCCSSFTANREKEIETIDIADFEKSNKEIEYLTFEYMKLSRRNDIYFDNFIPIEVTNRMGFKGIVGLCSYYNEYRKIKISQNFWKKATWTSKISLLFHELTHCYCGRSHDYGPDMAYQDAPMEKESRVNAAQVLANNEGKYKDGCPLSIMYPYVVEDKCTKRHYPEYIKEMFNRCDPY